jgi:hypothetical protein
MLGVIPSILLVIEVTDAAHFHPYFNRSERRLHAFGRGFNRHTLIILEVLLLHAVRFMHTHLPAVYYRPASEAQVQLGTFGDALQGGSFVKWPLVKIAGLLFCGYAKICFFLRDRTFMYVREFIGAAKKQRLIAQQHFQFRNTYIAPQGRIGLQRKINRVFVDRHYQQI